MDSKLSIIRGKTFTRVLRWAALPFIYKPITAIARTAPVRITAAGHGLVAGWRVAVVSAQGMSEINAANPPKTSEYRRCTVVDADTVDLNAINAAEFSAYTSGGYLQFYTPVSLDGALVRMTVKNKVGGDTLLALDSDQLGGIAVDDTLKTITISVSATDTAAFAWHLGQYEIEIEQQDGTVKQLARGAITVADEVAT